MAKVVKPKHSKALMRALKQAIRESRLRTTGDATKGQIEVRYDEREKLNIDEVCANDCHVHLERMGDGEWALMIYAPREIGCYWLCSKNGKAHVEAVEGWRDNRAEMRRAVAATASKAKRAASTAASAAQK